MTQHIWYDYYTLGQHFYNTVKWSNVRRVVMTQVHQQNDVFHPARFFFFLPLFVLFPHDCDYHSPVRQWSWHVGPFLPVHSGWATGYTAWSSRKYLRLCDGMFWFKIKFSSKNQMHSVFVSANVMYYFTAPNKDQTASKTKKSTFLWGHHSVRSN